MTQTSVTRVLYDAKLKRPGCVLLAAAYGCDTDAARRFPIDSWLLYPTKDLAQYETTPEQLDALVELSLLAEPA